VEKHDMQMRLRAACGAAAIVACGPASAQAGLELDGYLWPPGEGVQAAVAGAGTEFGHAVALLGDVALVGASREVVHGTSSGVVHVACRTADGGDWIRLPAARLDGRSLGDGARFGAAIAAAGKLVAVGAPRADGPGGSMSGVVHLFALDRRTGGSRLLAELAPPGGSDGAAFGASLAFDARPGAARRIAIGAPQARDGTGSVPLAGAVHVFVENGAHWLPQITLHAPTPGVAAGFGSSVAFVDGVLVVGTPGDGTLAPGAGRVFAFDETGALRWELGPGGNAAGARYGSPLCVLDAQTLAIGLFGRGGVEVVKVGGSATQHQSLLRGEPLGGFGVAIAGSGCDLFVGAPFGGPSAGGAVQRFVRDRGKWKLAGTLSPSPATTGGEFGVALAVGMGGDGVRRLLVGEPASDAPCPPNAQRCGAGRAVVFDVVRECHAR